MFEQLREVPGLTLVPSGGRGGTTSLFTRGGESDHNLILIDGVKVNRAGGAFNFNDLTTLGVGRIEVVRGPQSALYGSDAMSSVIQLLTPRGQGPPRASLGFRAGNPDTFEERAGRLGRNEPVWLQPLPSDGSIVRGSCRSIMISAIPPLRRASTLTPTTPCNSPRTVRYIDSRFHFPTSSGDRIDRRDNKLDPRAYTDNRRPDPWPARGLPARGLVATQSATRAVIRLANLSRPAG